jgi:VCBS repeat-containing protein
MDSFIYTVVDDGTTVGSDGNLINDPRIASNTVTFEVLPVNDAPVFSGAGSVLSAEDAGVVNVESWATNIQAGPTTANDEIGGNESTLPQGLEFVFTQISSNTDLFRTPPSAIIDSATGVATLSYETTPDANGIATFEVVLEDTGPRDASIGDDFVSDPPRTFSINVSAVNDPPSYDLASSVVTRSEDSGPFNVVQVVNISPGPEDESSQTVTFSIEPLAPEFAELFSEQPTISADGLLRFTPAPNRNTDNANGPAIIRVIGTDSEGAVAAGIEFSIVITEVNDPPRATSDSFDTDEDSVLVLTSADLIANDDDPDLLSNEAEVVQVVMPEQSFSVSGALVTFDPATGQITYDPTDAVAVQALAPGELLSDSFAYSTIDAAGETSNLVTVALNVTGINDAPILGLDTPQLNLDGTTTIRVLDNDTDVDGSIDSSSIEIELQPAFGSVTIAPDGSLLYTPFTDFQDDTFSYTVADNLGARSEDAFVTISTNASPIARDDSRGTFLDESVLINVSANDIDPDGTLDFGSIVIVDQPNRGQAIPQADGTVQYIPDPGFVGRDTFEYQIFDELGRGSNVATVDTQVVASRLQNPDEASDVNDDGFITALDALLIINHLTRSDAISIPVGTNDRGPNFFDVSGNQQVSAADALRVINQLSLMNDGEAEAEQLTLQNRSETEERVIVDVAFDAPGNLLGPDKIVDVALAESVSADVLELVVQGRETDAKDSVAIDAVDAAMADLL